MIKKIAEIKQFKKILLITLLIFSFSLLKSFNPIAIFSVNGILLSLIFVLIYGFFHWLLFEIIAIFFYSALKPKIENNITMHQFINILRMFIIASNIIIYIVSSFLIFINFYTVFLLLFFNIVFSFFILIYFYKTLKKYYLKNLANKSFNITYFCFVFCYLFLLTIMWGVL